MNHPDIASLNARMHFEKMFAEADMQRRARALEMAESRLGLFRKLFRWLHGMPMFGERPTPHPVSK